MLQGAKFINSKTGAKHTPGTTVTITISIK